MSWGYWGIVLGLLVMVCLFFVSVEIMARGGKAQQTGKETAEAGRSTKHAA
jgi:hypothetical protein